MVIGTQKKIKKKATSINETLSRMTEPEVFVALRTGGFDRTEYYAKRLNKKIKKTCFVWNKFYFILTIITIIIMSEWLKMYTMMIWHIQNFHTKMACSQRQRHTSHHASMYNFLCLHELQLSFRRSMVWCPWRCVPQVYSVYINCISPPGDRWCDVLGVVPKGI